jgi:hypothetical protein
LKQVEDVTDRVLGVSECPAVVVQGVEARDEFTPLGEEFPHLLGGQLRVDGDGAHVFSQVVTVAGSHTGPWRPACRT